MILCSLLFITVIGGAHSDDSSATFTKRLNNCAQCATNRAQSCCVSAPVNHHGWTADLQGVHSISSVSISVCDEEKYTSDLSGIQIHIGNSLDDECATNHIYKNITNFAQNGLIEFDTSVSGRYFTIFTDERGPNVVLCEVKIWSTKKDSPFKLFRKEMKWADALYYCRARDMDLASILDQEAQAWAELETQKANTSFVWLGLRYTCTLGFWFWVEDYALQFSRWSPNNKKEECNMSVAMEAKEERGDHLWFSKSDDEKFNFICVKQSFSNSGARPPGGAPCNVRGGAGA